MPQTVLSKSKLVEIFVLVDDFLEKFTPVLNSHLLGVSKWGNKKMSKSEAMTILIFFHFSGVRCFKWYYQIVVCQLLRKEFGYLYTYEEFVRLQSQLSLELFAFLYCCRLASCSEANYIDSTKLEVCHIRRASNHKVFKNLAQKGKSSMGYFYGFKLHLICNQDGELVNILLTSGNKADNNSKVLMNLFEKLTGAFYGDKGYLTTMKDYFKMQNVSIITKKRKNMKPEKLSDEQLYYLQQRGIIESIFDILKNFCQINHTRHRSPKNFLTNLWSGLIAYTFLDSKPHINKFDDKLSKNDIVLYQDAA